MRSRITLGRTCRRWDRRLLRHRHRRRWAEDAGQRDVRGAAAGWTCIVARRMGSTPRESEVGGVDSGASDAREVGFPLCSRHTRPLPADTEPSTAAAVSREWWGRAEGSALFEPARSARARAQVKLFHTSVFEY